MLSQICLYLKNWFDYGQTKYFGTFTIENGTFDVLNDIQTGQYYRIVGSVFNDGIYKRGSEKADTLKDETFDGAVWLMAVPKDVESLATEIAMWQEKYGSLDSENMSPYQSESFGGYSYSKSSGGDSGNGTSVSWQNTFADRLRRYRKV